jgi:glycosyltransferase involved in cell wall biosynthesis
LPEVVKDGDNGVLCELDQHAKFVSTIRLLRKNPELLLRLGANARRTAVNSFSIERMVDEYVKLFEELLG